MTSKLIPQNPEEVMVIRELVPGITTLSVPFLRFGRIKFGGRATIGTYSPFPLPSFSNSHKQFLTSKKKSQTPLLQPRSLLPRRPNPNRKIAPPNPRHRKIHNLPGPRTPHLPLVLGLRLPFSPHPSPRRAGRKTRRVK